MNDCLNKVAHFLFYSPQIIIYELPYVCPLIFQDAALHCRNAQDGGAVPTNYSPITRYRQNQALAVPGKDD